MQQQHGVSIRYQNMNGGESERDVDPYGLVFHYGRWYLVGLDHLSNEIRTFRVDRISEVRLLDDTFEVPADLDPAAELEANLGKGWEYDTHVVFHAPIAEVRPWVRPTLGDLRELPDGQCELVGSTSNPQAYAGEWLAGVPFDFTVVGGDELRAAVAEVGARLTGSVSG